MGNMMNVNLTTPIYKIKQIQSFKLLFDDIINFISSEYDIFVVGITSNVLIVVFKNKAFDRYFIKDKQWVKLHFEYESQKFIPLDQAEKLIDIVNSTAIAIRISYTVDTLTGII